jgi:hypothetical protein
MKYIKTFESFDQAFTPEVNEGLVSWAKGVFGKIMDKFNSWRNKLAKEAATKLAVVIEEKSSEPAVQAKMKEIQKQYASLSAEERKTFDSMANEDEANKVAKELDKADIKELVKESLEQELEGLSLNEALLTESAKEIIGKIMTAIGTTIAIATIIYSCIVFCTLVGAGYVAAWAIGAGMTAGAFGATACGVIAASGTLAGVGAAMRVED